MKIHKLSIIVLFGGIVLGTIACGQRQTAVPTGTAKQPPVKPTATLPAPGQTAKAPVPAFQSAETAKNLKPTLSPEMFDGTVRAAYAMVKEIPETIAQLPCYCHCDKSMGHKSLHSCFEDDHAAKCGICLNSAMIAYKLQKEQKLTPEQIREKLNTQYGQA